MSNLPNYNHKFNYNARAFSAGTYTNLAGTFPDLVLERIPSQSSGGGYTGSTDYVTLSAFCSQNILDTDFNSPSAMTIIAKGAPTYISTNYWSNIMANRYSTNYYNWMLRFAGMSNGDTMSYWAGFSAGEGTKINNGSSPQVVVYRHSGNTFETWHYTDNVKASTTASGFGPYSSNNRVRFFYGYNTGGDARERWDGNFYWVYGINEYLSDSDVSQVVVYNENYGRYDTKTSEFTAAGGTDTYSLETEASWNAVSDSLWISVSPSSGTGNETLTITVGRNNGSASRTGTVTVTDTSDNTLLIWTVEQGYRATPVMNIIYNNSTW